MKKIFLSLIFIIGFAYLGISQSRYIFTQYFINPVLINPGAAGCKSGQRLFLNYRNTWSNHPGSPRTFGLSYDGMLTDKVGVGAFIMNDTYGALQTTKGVLSYSYKIKGENYDFGLGFTTEYLAYKVSGGLTGGSVDRNDPLIAEKQDGAKYFDVAIGAHGIIQKKFILSVVLPGLVRSKLNKVEGETVEEKSFNYILGVGYIYKVDDYDMKVLPSLYVKKLRNINTLIDANLLLTFYDDKLSGGVTYGMGDDKRLGFIIGAKLNKINFYYSYDFSFKKFQTYNNGSHEMTFAYNFGE
jgi:type IX secretion system PorP/SprF family membrane protein